MKTIKIFTIGFTKKTANGFFEKLKQSGAKRDDLIYFLKEIANMDYIHLPDMAPTKDILDEYKKNKGDWSTYEYKFMKLMEQRSIEKQNIKNIVHQGCLLCSEHKPDYCHRRLIVEYLQKKWTDETLQVIHL